MPATPTGSSELSLCLRVLHSDFRLVFVRPESRERMARLWSRCSTESVPDRAVHVIRVDGADSPLTEARILTVSTVITETAIAEYRGGALLLRAMAVANVDGEVTVVLGPQGVLVQKAVIELAGSDMTYVSSSVLAIAADGRVSACPQPLRLKSAAPKDDAPNGSPSTEVPLHHTVVCGPDDLSLRRCPEGLVLGGIVAIEVVDDPPLTGAAERLTLADAVMAIAPYVAAYPTGDGPLQKVCQLLDAASGLNRLTISRGEDRLANTLRALPAASTSTEGGGWAPIDSDAVGVNAMAWRLRDGRVRPAPCRDAVEVAGDAVILLGERPVRLSPLGLTLWRRGGATLEDLEAAAVARHGWHPEASTLVRDALGALRDAGAVGFGPPLTLEDALAGRVAL